MQLESSNFHGPYFQVPLLNPSPNSCEPYNRRHYESNPFSKFPNITLNLFSQHMLHVKGITTSYDPFGIFDLDFLFHVFFSQIFFGTKHSLRDGKKTKK